MIVRVFPRRTSFTPTDAMAFIGDPPLFLPVADEVHVSVAFTWDRPEGQRLAEAWANHYPVVKLGGPAFASAADGFTPGQYVKHGVTFTTRGCDRACPWCLVPGNEGAFREIPDFAPGWIVQDNNLLMASRSHLLRVFEMLRVQRHAAVFSGGLDTRLMDDWVVDQLRTLRIDQLFLAADTMGSLTALGRALGRLALPRRKLRVYMLCGFGGDTIQEATERVQHVWRLGAMPFVQLYQPAERRIDYSPEWRDFARLWSRPAAMMAQANKEATI